MRNLLTIALCASIAFACQAGKGQIVKANTGQDKSMDVYGTHGVKVTQATEGDDPAFAQYVNEIIPYFVGPNNPLFQDNSVGTQVSFKIINLKSEEGKAYKDQISSNTADCLMMAPDGVCQFIAINVAVDAGNGSPESGTADPEEDINE